MNACQATLTGGIDLAACAWQVATGWVPDWLWPLLPFLPFLAVIAGAGVAYAIGRWPAVAAYFGAIGLIVGFRLGRASVEEPHENIKPGTPDADPPVGRRRNTIFGGKRG